MVRRIVSTWTNLLLSIRLCCLTRTNSLLCARPVKVYFWNPIELQSAQWTDSDPPSVLQVRNLTFLLLLSTNDHIMCVGVGQNGSIPVTQRVVGACRFRLSKLGPSEPMDPTSFAYKRV